MPDQKISSLSYEYQSLSSHLASVLGAKPDMPGRKEYLFFLTASILFVLGILGVLVYVYLEPLRQQLYRAINNPEKLAEVLGFCGPYGPLLFIAIQALQVLLMFWPVPFELAGGYLFGIVPGTIYSTIGLTLGTIISFYLGRYLHRIWLVRLMSPDVREFFQRVIRREGVLAAFLIYLLPLPKDFVGYLFGMIGFSLPFFLFFSTLGRLPNTILMSYQGTKTFNGDLTSTIASFVFSAIIGYFLFKNREFLFQWLERWQSEGE